MAFAASAEAEPDTVRIGTFTRLLPVIVAEGKGFWAAQGITVELSQVAGSLPQAKALAEGGYDLAFSSADNVVNYRLNPRNKLGRPLDLQIIGALDRGAGLSLVAKPELPAVSALKGAKIGLDAFDSGFAFVLYKMLRGHGLEPGRDYQVTAAGGTPQRLGVLTRGEIDATLLSAGFEVRAFGAGFRSLAHVNDVANPYLGITVMGRESWMEAHEDVVVRLIKGYADALAWSVDPLNRGEAIGLLMAASPGTGEALAARQYEAQVVARDGLAPEMTIDVAGLRHVLELRQEFGGFDEPKSSDEIDRLAAPASGLWTPSYLEKARARR